MHTVVLHVVVSFSAGCNILGFQSDGFGKPGDTRNTPFSRCFVPPCEFAGARESLVDSSSADESAFLQAAVHAGLPRVHRHCLGIHWLKVRVLPHSEAVCLVSTLAS